MARDRTLPPALKREKSRGFYYCRWGGKLHTFGTIQTVAMKNFLAPESMHPGSLAKWKSWSDTKATQRTRAPTKAGPRLVIDLVELFIDSYTGRPNAQRYIRYSLRRFTHAFGAFRTDIVDESLFEAFRLCLLKMELSPKTVSHDIKAAKNFWRWASRTYGGPWHGGVPRLELSAIKAPPQTPPQPKPISREKLRSMIGKCRQASPPDGFLGECVAMMYLALLRPTELLRIINGEGTFAPVIYPDTRHPTAEHPTHGEEHRVVPKGLYVIKSKVEHRTGMPRYVVLSEQALLQLELVQGLAQRHRGLVGLKGEGRRRGFGVAIWTRLDSFSAAVRAASDLPPSVVRDTAASDLHASGVDWGVVDQLLGHMPKGAGRSYIQTAWHTLRAQAGRLRL